MDIRNWLKKKPVSSSSNVAVKQSLSSTKKNKSRIIDPDSDEDNDIISRKRKITNESVSKSKKKRIIDSSDSDESDEKNAKKPKKLDTEKIKKPLRMQISDSSSEDVSPVKRQQSPFKSNSKAQSKFEKLTTSKFFKETSANDVFGNEPVKRSDSKLKTMQEKLKSFKPVKADLKLDDDAEFEAALVQLDEIGDNWANLTNASEKKQSASDSDLGKKIALPDSLSSGYFSADSTVLSSDSQTLEESDVKLNPSVIITKLEDDELKKSNNKIVKHKSSTVIIPKENGISVFIKPADESFSLWVEKYKPQSSKRIIGQQGEKSNVNKLILWLTNWFKNNVGSKKASFVPGGWNKDPTGACFKAALLSGPPGVGKTTTVSLVCKELGFDLVEFNASDTRSKKLLHEEVSELLKCTSLSPFFSKQNTESTLVTRKHVLVMDEVDGMAGNEDRGGIQELIQLIKFSKIPVICMCNDRNHPKIRSLVNYCFDLRFSRPRVEQIKGYMMSVCFREKLQLSSEALVDIITSANNDVRLVLNHLSMLAADKNSQNLEAAKKYVKLSAWDVLRKVFSKEDHKKMSIHDKWDLFFFDYNIAPLFVQENYLSIKPLNVDAQNKKKKMELFARAAQCISMGDRIDLQIRKNNSWSLLPTQAVFASYAPGEILEGYCSAQINFPAWLGKNSKRSRIDRLLQEVQIHTRLKISASKESVNLDYAPYLKNRIIGPLVEHGSDGVKDALNTLHEYDLLKEDLDSLQEICQWPNSVNINLESKVKSAFTRAYNKNPPVRPYSLAAPVKKASAIDSLPDEEEDVEEGEKSDDDSDAMIVTKKPHTKKPDVSSASTSKTKAKTDTSQIKRPRKK